MPPHFTEKDFDTGRFVLIDSVQPTMKHDRPSRRNVSDLALHFYPEMPRSRPSVRL
jgi:hypothetical protein